MPLELACSRKLLKELGTRAESLPHPAQNGLDVWYADLFYESRRKCVLLRNPTTGLIGLYPFVNRELIRTIPAAWPSELVSMLRRLGSRYEFDSVIDTIPRTPCTLCRTDDRSSLASLVQLRPDVRHRLHYLNTDDPMHWARDYCFESAEHPIGPNYSQPLTNLRQLMVEFCDQVSVGVSSQRLPGA